MRDGGPAFPIFHGNGTESPRGMSLRAYFAAHAPITLDEISRNSQLHIDDRLDMLAKLRWKYADKMLERMEG